jgi:hypothetical protein
MNIIQLHDKVLAFLDQTRSGRIDPHMVDSAINTVIDASVKQRIGSENVVGETGFYPSESTRLRNSLGYYYKTETMNSVTPRVNLIRLLAQSQKEPLMLLDNIELNIGTIGSPSWITPVPVSKKDRPDFSNNTFLAPSLATWKNTYFSYDGHYLDFLLPASVVTSQIRLGYYSKPKLVSHGTLVNTVDFVGTEVNVIFYSSTALYNGIKRFRGEEEIVDSILLSVGSIVKDFAEVDIDPEILEQVCMGAAKLIVGMRAGILNEGKEN